MTVLQFLRQPLFSKLNYDRNNYKGIIRIVCVDGIATPDLQKTKIQEKHVAVFCAYCVYDSGYINAHICRN
jgi:hypothetical protein